MRVLEKIIPYEELANWRASLPAQAKPLVVTNGCFDILHPGHLFLLEKARAMGKMLLVGLTGDAAIQKLKGAGRPTVPERDRVLMLCGFEFVSRVCLFPDLDAVAFLEKSRPDIYVKGGDYTIETINQDERRFLEFSGVTIEIVPKFENQSTSAILRKILEQRSLPTL